MPRPTTALSIWLEEVPHHPDDEHPSVAICYTSGRETYSVHVEDRNVNAIASALAPILLANLYHVPRHVRPVRAPRGRPKLTADEIDNLLNQL